MLRLICSFVAILATVSTVQTAEPIHQMELPAECRQWYRNPDGSCVQCSIGMCGVWLDCPPAYTLLWDTEYGKKVRGGSWPQRVADYSVRRQIPIYNVTGRSTYDWMKWAAKTGRFAAIGAGSAHFQTLYGWDSNTNTWFVCNNNSPSRIDSYTWARFQRLHEASGQWVVILDKIPSPAVPRYVQWW